MMNVRHGNDDDGMGGVLAYGPTALVHVSS